MYLERRHVYVTRFVLIYWYLFRILTQRLLFHLLRHRIIFYVLDASLGTHRTPNVAIVGKRIHYDSKMDLTHIFVKKYSFYEKLGTTWTMFSSLRVRTHWSDKICFALKKFSTKFVPAKFSICQAWAHWYTAKYLLTTSFNHTEINTIACSLFEGKATWDQ